MSWLTHDPIGFKDGLNMYAYVHNNSLRYANPNRKFAFVIPFVVGAFGVGGITICLPKMTAIAGAIAGTVFFS
jgi:hypothetical protein